ncbi:MAG: Gldg family protein [Pseudomonadota bacterium]
MRRHAWLLAALGVLGLLFHGVAVLVRHTWDGWPAIVGGVGLTLVLLWLWLDWDALRRAAQGRALRFSLVSGLLVLLSIGLAVALNVLAVRQDHRWDLTSSGRHTLAPQTVELLSGLTEPVQVLAFFPAGSADEQSFDDLLEACVQQTDQLQVSHFDPYLDATMVRQHGVTSPYGTVVLLQGDTQQRLETDFSEEAFDNALLRLVSGAGHTVCWLTDHGEGDPDDDEAGGFSGAVMKLEGQGYAVEKLSILQRGGVPATCEVVLAAAPKVDLLPEEREAMAGFLAGGGAAIYLLEPLHGPETVADLRRYGLSLRPDVVLQEDPQMAQLGFDASQLRVLPEEFGYHPIMAKLDSVVLLQLVRSVTLLDPLPEGLRAAILLHTGPEAWAETSLEEGGPFEPTEGVDLTGTVGLAAAVQIEDPAAIHAVGHDLAPAAEAEAPAARAGGRLVVFGDAGFASNAHLLDGLNMDLLLNSVAWSVDEEDQITLRPRDAADGMLDYNLLQALLMWFFCLIGAPGLAISAALFTWLRRRRL